MNQLILQYSYLQVLDFLTTLAFMINGVQEGNPVVRLALRYHRTSGTTRMEGYLVLRNVALKPVAQLPIFGARVKK